MNIEKGIEYARLNWHTPAALIVLEVIVLSLFSVILKVINPSSLSKILTYFVVFVIPIIIWLLSKRLQKTKEGKVGILICISSSDEGERSKIKEDFVRTLNDLLKAGPIGKSFQLLQVPEHIAEKIEDEDDAQKLRLKCRAHFMIYGRVRLRSINGAPTHFLNLEGIVAHKPIPHNISKEFSEEFSELLPRRLSIPTENDIFTFEITSKWVNIVAKYIIGTAAVLSGDLDYAERLYNDVFQRLTEDGYSFPIYRKLRDRIPLRLAEINYIRANIAYSRWQKTRASEDIEKLGYHLDKIHPPYSKTMYGVILLNSIYLFVKDRDVRKAISLLKKCKTNEYDDGTWLYSLGFLHAYSGKLRKAIQYYRNAMKQPTEGHVISQIEEFLYWLVGIEPEKYQLYYCLGFINLKIKEDMAQAVNNLESFLSAGDEREFALERHKAKTWIAEHTST
jgi:tetratricopeptide (TPR) repeat protein